MRLIHVSLAGLLLLAACGDPGAAPGDTVPADPAVAATIVPGAPGVDIAAVYERVEYYGACGNETVTVEGVTYYPVLGEDLPEIEVGRSPLVGAMLGIVGRLGAAPQVAPPGPGDDIGDMIVYTDGIARFESDSGWVIWLTDQEQTYTLGVLTDPSGDRAGRHAMGRRRLRRCCPLDRPDRRSSASVRTPRRLDRGYGPDRAR